MRHRDSPRRRRRVAAFGLAAAAVVAAACSGDSDPTTTGDEPGATEAADAPPGAAADTTSSTSSTTTTTLPPRPWTVYVDCDGSDDATGLDEDEAWATLTKASDAPLEPGDSILFRRGCTWDTGERLIAGWAGSEAQPITIGAYGTGDRPRFMNGRNDTIRVTGSYLVLQDLSLDNEPDEFAVCGAPYQGNTRTPVGTYYGINITMGGHHIVVQRSIMQHSTAGLHISKTAGGFNRILHNQFVNNDVMQLPFGADLGAWGMLFRTDDNEIAYNRFSNNVARCGDGENRFIDSNSVELFEGSRNSIHHNTAIDDRVFSEMGSSEGVKARDNYYGFNTIVSSIEGARFVNTRGSGDLEFGPVFGTAVEHNTVIFTGEFSEPLICSDGCSPDIISVRNNIFQTPGRAVTYTGSIDMSDNILWGGPSGDGSVIIQDDEGRQRIPLGTIDPRFVVTDPGFRPGWGWYLSAESPAIDAAATPSPTTNELADTAIVGAGRDIGATEFIAD